MSNKPAYTPLYLLSSDDNNNKIYIKRDDLIPFSFGGNKARIAQEFVADMQQKGKNFMVGYGNARSNLSRALTNLCANKNIPCLIISPSEDNGSRIETPNSKIVKNILGVQFVECDKQKVAQCVLETLSELREKGYNPYYIYGNEYGTGNEAVSVRAYLKAYDEIKEQGKELNVQFDYIFLATGTGMTQAGLILGKQKNNGAEKIVGISVAREKAKEVEVIKRYINSDAIEEIEICDKYLCGGYGAFDSGIEKQIIKMFKCYGIPLDPTYTGKGYYGMAKYIKECNIANKNILFLHTGGTPLFFDWLSLRKDN